MARTIIYFSILLLALYILQWWLLYYYLDDVPKYIEGTTISISGLALAVVILPTLYFFQQTIYKNQINSTVIQLTGLSILLAIITEALFQLVRQSVSTATFSYKIVEGAKGVGIAALLVAPISFMMAFKLKHKKSVWNTVFTFVFFAIVYVIKTYTSIL